MLMVQNNFWKSQKKKKEKKNQFLTNDCHMECYRCSDNQTATMPYFFLQVLQQILQEEQLISNSTEAYGDYSHSYSLPIKRENQR